MELVNWIREQVEAGKFQPGQKMYSENELKEMFGLSRQTVRHAISVLENDGVLNRRQGSGTYINDRRQTNLRNKTRISVVTTYVDGYIFPKTIQGIENVLFENGYSVRIALPVSPIRICLCMENCRQRASRLFLLTAIIRCFRFPMYR